MPCSRLLQGVAAPDDLELVAAILCPRRLVVSLRQRALFTVGHGLDALRLDAVAHEVLLGRGRPAVAEGQVILVRAAPARPPRRSPRSAAAASSPGADCGCTRPTRPQRCR